MSKILNIVIKESNKERIEAEIKLAEGKATVRKLEFSDIIKTIERVEKKLDISKKSMTGIKIFVDVNAQPFPNAYKYIPDSTHFSAIKTKTGWNLLDIERDRCRDGYGKRVEMILTDEAKKEILKNYECF